MEERSKGHVGLDVHKDSITVAAAEPGREKAQLVGKVVHDVPRLLKVLASKRSMNCILERCGLN